MIFLGFNTLIIAQKLNKIKLSIHVIKRYKKRYQNFINFKNQKDLYSKNA